MADSSIAKFGSFEKVCAAELTPQNSSYTLQYIAKISFLVYCLSSRIAIIHSFTFCTILKAKTLNLHHGIIVWLVAVLKYLLHHLFQGAAIRNVPLLNA
jgi:hypothetical protein